MRTTVTLDPDVVAALHRVARERGTSFKAVLNDAVRRGLSAEFTRRSYRTPTRDLGLRTGFDIDKGMALVAADEDGATLHKLALNE